MLLKLYVPWNVVINFLPVIFVANKQDQAGALLLAWTREILLIKIIPTKIKALIKINIGFSPIHDVPPGIDHNGMLRAPIYNVGRINNEFFGDPYDRDAGHGTGREKSLQKYNEIYKKTHKK